MPPSNLREKRRAAVRLLGGFGWVHEVGLVPEGAIGRVFHAIEKAVGMNITLPKAAQASLLDMLGQLMEQALGLSDAIKGATLTEDPAAIVPPEVGQALDALSGGFEALAAQFGGPPVDDAGDVMPPEAQKAIEAASAGVAKILVAKFMGHNAAVAKAGGPKLTMSNFMKMQQGALAKLFDLVKEFGPLFSGDASIDTESLGKSAAQKNGEGAAAAGAGAASAAASTTAGAGTGAAAGDASGASSAAAASANTASTKDVLAEVGKIATNVKALTASVTKLAGARPTSNAAPLDGDVAGAAPDRQRGSQGAGPQKGKYANGENINEARKARLNNEARNKTTGGAQV